MKKLLPSETLRIVAAETGIEPAFVEKDFYAVGLMHLVQNFLDSAACSFQLVFSGGTSLSKAHQLIKRFSEDLDFLGFAKNGGVETRTHRRHFRRSLVEFINADDRFSVNPILVKNSSRNNGLYFQCIVSYPSTVRHSSLRDELQFEVTFKEPRIAPAILSIQSFVHSVVRQPAELEISCTNPLEIAGDKLSALAWRVLKFGGYQ